MMEKCNTYNTENLPPATSLVYFGIKTWLSQECETARPLTSKHVIQGYSI